TSRLIPCTANIFAAVINTPIVLGKARQVTMTLSSTAPSTRARLGTIRSQRTRRPISKVASHSGEVSLSSKPLRTPTDSLRSRVSAGLLMFRRRNGALEFLLVHPGGPFFVRKDEGAWSIPKGEAAPAEDLLTRARIEFAEELGIESSGDYLPLGTIKQKGGK